MVDAVVAVTSIVDSASIEGRVDMNSPRMKTVLHSASAVAVVSVLVSIVGAGTKWMH